MLRTKTIEGNKKPGRTYYKEIVTEGRDKYQLQNTDTGETVAVHTPFVAQLVETVPVHTPCFQCGKYISNFEADMAEYMIYDECGMCKKKQIDYKLSGKDIEVECTHRKQTFVCFECFEDMCVD